MFVMHIWIAYPYYLMSGTDKKLYDTKQNVRQVHMPSSPPFTNNVHLLFFFSVQLQVYTIYTDWALDVLPLHSQ